MKLTKSVLKLSFAAFFGAAFLTSCGKTDDSTAAGADGTESAATAPVAARDDLPVKKIEVTGNDLMKFNIEKMEAQARQKVEVTLKNIGTMPKQSMGHNWALLALNVDAGGLLEAGFASAGNDYIVPERENEVIVRTKILGPGESETVTFTAPSEPGSYQYVCTFPGHFGAGMKGVLVITE
jgi:azurin